ncbi:MAG TPA: FAD-dependent oxidoreductase, partial [Acidimicrobiales bacterium]|nr:FAD-dependent oxidoreductase [Acidimicrobiales bacterium]
MTESRQVVIVGSGPAGLTAAIYASRAQLAPLVIEGEPSSTSDQPGGQLMLTTEVENFPGFVNGIMGPELMQAFREQAARFGADYVTAKVSRVDLSSRPFGIWIGDPDAGDPTYAAEALIISTGAQSLMLNLPNEERLLGYGVSTCATCDGFFFREREIAVVGGGDSALEEALFLTRFADKVTVIHRRGELRASKVMQQRAFANEKITFRWNASVVDVLGENTVTGVRVRDNLSEEESEIALSGLFVAIGHEPNTGLFKGELEMEE